MAYYFVFFNDLVDLGRRSRKAHSNQLPESVTNEASTRTKKYYRIFTEASLHSCLAEDIVRITVVVSITYMEQVSNYNTN